MLDALKFGAVASFGGKKGDWGFWTDFAYSDVGGSKQQSRDLSLGGQGIPAGLSSNLVLDMKSVFWTMAGTYELNNTSANTTDLVFSARLADVRETLSWSMNGNLAGTGQSKLTWQANLGIGYRFDWGATVLSWRYLDDQMKSGVPIQSMSMSGPLLGAAFQW